MSQNHGAGFDDRREMLLDMLLSEEGLAAESQAPIPPREQEGPLPLTDAQMRIWLMEKMESGSVAYLINAAARLRLPLQASLLEEALLIIWRRHEALRTTFIEEDGQVWQRPDTAEAPRLHVRDHSEVAEEAREEVIQREIAADSSREFDLSTGPLLRATLLRLDGDDHVFILTTHHLISDGWSVNLILRELVTAYRDLIQQRRPTLPPAGVQFGDYAHWQQQWLESPKAQRELAYWKEQLSNPPAPTELPADFDRPARQTFSGGRQRRRLDANLVQGARRLSSRAGATLFMTLLATFKVLFHRHTGAEEVVVGSPVAGRQRPELESVVGLFLNTLVLRTDLGGDPSFLELLERVRDTTTAAFAHQAIPFERLLIELQPARDPSRSPFFQVFFNMLRFDDAPAAPDGPIQFLEMPEAASKFDLTLYLEEVGDELELTLVYNRDLFSGERIADFLRQYEKLLAQVVAAPERPLNAYDLLTDAARSVVPDPREPLSERWEGPIAAAVERHARRAPEKVAVEDDTGRWTYGDVATLSSRLARALHDRGVRKGDVVAVAGHRCAALVPALIGVLKVGAVGLILDPAYPEARQIEYVAAAKPAGWLTFTTSPPPGALHAAAKASAGNAIFALPEEPEAWGWLLEDAGPSPPELELGPDDPALLTFTSGSTGKPKGIVGLHGSLTHFYPWMSERFDLTEADRFSMLSGLAHDPLQRDIFTALWVGATIHVPNPQRVWEPGYLHLWLRTHQITVTHLIPSMLYALSDASQDEPMPMLRRALFVGEPLTRENARILRQLAPNVRIVNLYGTSETQRAVSYYELENAAPDGERPPLSQVPLGRGMPGAQLLVLNDERQLAGIGELGELYVRSPHLAAGYWHDPEKTAARFLSNPWGSSVRDRLYRTGDFGRYRPDGQVIFAGRRDQQVTIRGMRVELTGIEAVLRAHPEIGAAVVDIAEDDTGVPQIVAYVVRQNGKESLTARDIRTLVKNRFPAPVVPAIVQFIDTIPLTPNGKTDRAALPRPTFASTPTPAGAPADSLEATLVEMWEELLGRRPIGVHDDFFELGGHSLLAVRLFSRIRASFGVELNLGILFQHSTIAEIAELLRREAANKGSRTTSNVVCIQQGAVDEPRFFCVHGAGGNVLFMEEWRKYVGQWSLYGLESPAVDGLSWPEPNIEAQAEMYIENLRRVQPQGPYLLGGYSGGGILAYEIAQQLRAQGGNVELLVLIDTHHPSIGPRSFSWFKRLQRILTQPLEVLKRIYAQLVIAIRLRRMLKNYVAAGRQVPLEMRDLLIANYYVESKESYVPRPYAGRTLLIHSLEQFPAYEHVPRHLGWEGVIEHLEIADLPGNHFSVVKDPYAGALITEIRAAWHRRPGADG